MSEQDNILTYYQRELAYLRNAGAKFSRAHPKIANRLELGPNEAGDPHVERLMQSFAYLSAKLQKSVDDYFPRISNALLDILYPHFSRPVPSMTIVKFDVANSTAKLTSAANVARHTPLFAESSEAEVCRFRTCYDMELWPVKTSDVEILRTEYVEFLEGKITTQNCLKLRIQPTSDDLNSLDLKKLRFYLSGDRRMQSNLYELFFTRDLPIVEVSYQGDDRTNVRSLPTSSVKEVGFEEDQSIYPFPDNAHPAYRLLFEYFNFPQKFAFLDLENISTAHATTALEFYIPMPEVVNIAATDLSSQNIQLNCVPAVNLFPRTSEPLNLDHKRIEYRLVGDYRRERTTEIHSINRVLGIHKPSDPAKEYAPYFSFSHPQIEEGQSTFWSARRTPSERADIPGSDMYLTFTDYSFNPKKVDAETVYAEILCTNRELPKALGAGTKLQSETSLPTSEIFCLENPTDPVRTAYDGETLWRLISHLSVNYLSLNSDKQSLEALKEMLRLYANTDFLDEPGEIVALSNLTVTDSVRRVNREAWRGFVPGVKVTLEYDMNRSSDGSPFMLSTILSHFFSLYVSMNSFCELEIRDVRRKGVWKQWPVRVGNQTLI